MSRCVCVCVCWCVCVCVYTHTHTVRFFTATLPSTVHLSDWMTSRHGVTRTHTPTGQLLIGAKHHHTTLSSPRLNASNMPPNSIWTSRSTREWLTNMPPVAWRFQSNPWTGQWNRQCLCTFYAQETVCWPSCGLNTLWVNSLALWLLVLTAVPSGFADRGIIKTHSTVKVLTD